MKKFLIILATSVAVASIAQAKLPAAPAKSDAEKAAEADKAKAAKDKEAAELGKAQDKAVANYKKNKGVSMDAKDGTAAGTLLQPTLSAIDRAISKGVLEENTGNRYKSRLTIAINGLRATAKA